MCSAGTLLVASGRSNFMRHPCKSIVMFLVDFRNPCQRGRGWRIATPIPTFLEVLAIDVTASRAKSIRGRANFGRGDPTHDRP